MHRERYFDAKYRYTIFTVLVFCLAIFISFDSQLPSSKDYTQASKQTFSQLNALAHLSIIAEKPHFTGSDEHRKVRDYLVSELKTLGLPVEVFKHHSGRFHRFYMSAETQSIIARIEGKNSEKSVALMSHYDSGTHSSLGASDAGSGVVTILEGVRAFLAKGEQPQNDIVIVLTDGEEKGLLGAQAFVDNHPLAKNIEVVLNFEARGSGGPSYMILESNSGNEKLVEAFANAGLENPAANSLMYSIYKMLPNDTDLTVFRENADIQGFNFAFIDDHFDYHTAQDSVARLDKNTLNHQAQYLTVLLDYFAQADLTKLRSSQDDVYFNFPFLGMVHYSFDYATPMLVIVALGFLAFLFIAFKKNVVTPKNALISFVPATIIISLSALLGIYGWKLLLHAFPQYEEIPHGFTYNGYWLLAMFIAFAFAITTFIYKVFAKQQNGFSLSVAPLLIWLALNGFIAVKLTGAAFFILPVLATVAVLLWHLNNDQQSSWSTLLITLIFIVPGAMLLAPLIPAFVVGLGLKSLVIATVLTSLLTMLILLPVMSMQKLTFLTRLGIIVGIGCLLISVLNSDYNEQQKKPNSINYLLDVDNQQAYWLTSNRSMDSFIAQFFTENAQIDSTSEKNWPQAQYPNARSAKVRYFEETQYRDLQPAAINVVQHDIEENKHYITLEVLPKGNTDLIQLASTDQFKIERLRVNGHTFTEHGKDTSHQHKAGFFFWHTVVPGETSLEIQLVLEGAEPINFKLFETRYDLYNTFDFIEVREPVYMPEPFIINDAIIIGQTVLNQAVK